MAATETRGILDRDIALFVGDADAQHAPLLHQRPQPNLTAGLAAKHNFFRTQITEPQHQVVYGIRMARFLPCPQKLQLLFDIEQGIRIEQLAKIGIAQKLAQLRLINGERLCTAFCQGCVPFVNEVRNVAEQHRGRERRWNLRIRRVRTDGAGLDLSQNADQRGNIEDVAQALAISLEQDWE